MKPQVRIKKLHAIILGTLLKAELEDLGRLNFVVHREKQVVNNAIKHLAKSENLFDRIDEVVDKEHLDTLLNNLQDLTEFLKDIDLTIVPTLLPEWQKSYWNAQNEINKQ